MDKHWSEVLELAEKYGFIVQAYSGVAVLVTHKEQKKYFSKEKYKDIQNMNKEVTK